MTAGLVSDTKPRMGRKQINEPGEAVTARFPKGTLDRIRAVLAEKEPMAEFFRSLVEKEVSRRERATRKSKPADP